MVKKFFIIAVTSIVLVLVVGIFLVKKLDSNPKPPASAKAAQVKITAIEGWTNQDIANYLEKQNIVLAQDFLQAQKNYDISRYPILSSKPESADLEGFLFPDTYFILKPVTPLASSSASSIIAKMLDNFSLKFTPEMEQQAKNNGMTVYQTVILASIVEKETGRNATTDQQKQALDTERKTVAGIFYNRLAIHMPLQSDATVNYVTKKNDPQASLNDTKIDSPYNTYVYAGLPPGPICNPSLGSIMAVLYPTKSDYYYFLDTPQGQPIYSKTLEEHDQNKAKYLP